MHMITLTNKRDKRRNSSKNKGRWGGKRKKFGKNIQRWVSFHPYLEQVEFSPIARIVLIGNAHLI